MEITEKIFNEIISGHCYIEKGIGVSIETTKLAKECFNWHSRQMVEFAKFLAENCTGLYSDVGYYNMDGKLYSCEEIYEYWTKKYNQI